MEKVICNDGGKQKSGGDSWPCPVGDTFCRLSRADCLFQSLHFIADRVADSLRKTHVPTDSLADRVTNRRLAHHDKDGLGLSVEARW